MIDFLSVIFYWFLRSLGLLSRALLANHLGSGGTPFQDAVGVNCRMGATTDIKTRVPSIWARGVCIIIMHP